ncbi:MAG: hypothetical protein GY850_41365, partial [bacterium]|nr:hypothetical protein [bacterium]
METDDMQILVPLKLEALVVDDQVDKNGVLKQAVPYSADNQPNVIKAGDFKWSPLGADYRKPADKLDPAGPERFFGAGRVFNRRKTDQLILNINSPALPRKKDRGVYLHWVLPPKLRHAPRPNSLEFPPLPDQWLVVRFVRRPGGHDRPDAPPDGAPETRAWFIDGGIVADAAEGGGESATAANLMVADDEKRVYAGRRVGRAVALDEYRAADFADQPRTTITALGNRHTGSPTFTAFVADNRNVLSWHDDLDGGEVPGDAALSYLVVGWYRDVANDPLRAIPRMRVEKIHSPDNVLEALDWKLDADSPPTGLLGQGRCLFHGMIAHINYRNPDLYKGPLLGYPGAPSAHAGLRRAAPTLKVGVGNSLEDALVALVAGGQTENQKGEALWKALEAVVYRQADSLVNGWDEESRAQAVHQNGFTAQQAGKIWSIVPQERDGDTLLVATRRDTPADTDTPQPTADQLAGLQRLSDAQAATDGLARELASLQEDLYARWWPLCRKNLFGDDISQEQQNCAILARRIRAVQREIADPERQRTLTALAAELGDELQQAGLKLNCDAAPRFWRPEDPVIVVHNFGTPTKHQFPRPLSCRLGHQTATAAAVNGQKPQPGAPDIADITGRIKAHWGDSAGSDLAAPAGAMTALITEACIVEQAVADLIDRTLPAG